MTDNVLLRAEYLYDDYGEQNYQDEDGNDYDVDLSAQTIRGAVSFEFDSPAGGSWAISEFGEG